MFYWETTVNLSIIEVLVIQKVMPRSKSSARWLQEHFCDFYVKKAQQDNYRSRAVYKLQEIDEKERLIKPGMTIIDLGAAPGGWSQYISRKLNGQGLIFALDILPMDSIADVHCIQGDFCEDSTIDKINQLLKKAKIDLLLSDMAPNSSGNPAIDIPKAMHLAELALDFAHLVLKPGGSMVMKLFHGSGFETLVKNARSCFQQVVIRKPKASRARSRETYLLARQYKRSFS